MNTKITTYIILMLVMTMLSSCDTLLETEPAQSVSNETAVQDLSGLESVLIGAYDEMQSDAYYGGDFIIISEVLADNMKITVQNSNRFVNHWTNRPFAHFGFYNTAYDIINRANTIIQAIPNISADQVKLDQFEGEALFLRAIAHFDLLRSWARNPKHLIDGFNLGVVIRTEPFNGVVGDNAYPQRSTIDEVYTQIIQDLNDAIVLLSNANTISEFPFRASDIAAQALLSRVYLYQGDYDNAVDFATDVINNSPVSLTGPSAQDYLRVFSEGAESLFEIQITGAETRGLTSIGGLYRDDISYGDVVPTDELIAQFEVDDIRQDPLILDPPVAKGSEQVRYSQKYNGWDASELGTDNIIVIRLSEVYLNRAEAYAMQSNPDETAALADLNTIRQARGLAPLAVTGTDLINAILMERRLELAFEGHRAYDLKRNGMGFPKPGANTIIPYDDYRIVAPIYEEELDANPNIIQNPGYTSN